MLGREPSLCNMDRDLNNKIVCSFVLPVFFSVFKSLCACVKEREKERGSVSCPRLYEQNPAGQRGHLMDNLISVYIPCISSRSHFLSSPRGVYYHSRLAFPRLLNALRAPDINRTRHHLPVSNSILATSLRPKTEFAAI